MLALPDGKHRQDHINPVDSQDIDHSQEQPRTTRIADSLPQHQVHHIGYEPLVQKSQEGEEVEYPEFLDGLELPTQARELEQAGE